MQKYKIWWQGNHWVLSYYWPDEGGGGWSACAQCRFKWPLRIYAPLHKWMSDREVARLEATEKFEL